MKLKKTALFISALALLGGGCVKTDNPVKKPVETTKLNFSQTNVPLDDREVWYQALQWPKDCEADFKRGNKNYESGLTVYPVTQNQFLVRALCSKLAYQESAVFMLATTIPSEGSVSSKLLTMETYDAKTKKFAPIKDERGFSFGIGATTFNEVDKTFQNLAKYREAGDCGQVYTYKIENESAKLVRLQIRECPEKIPAPEKNWPVIYELK